MLCRVQERLPPDPPPRMGGPIVSHGAAEVFDADSGNLLQSSAGSAGRNPRPEPRTPRSARYRARLGTDPCGPGCAPRGDGVGSAIAPDRASAAALGLRRLAVGEEGVADELGRLPPRDAGRWAERPVA